MDVTVVLVVVGATLLVLALVSAIVKRLYLSTVLVALLVGVAVGPAGLAVVDPVAAPVTTGACSRSSRASRSRSR